MDLTGSETHRNLEEAFAREATASRRYRFFADAADVDGHPEVAAAFREVAEGEIGHATGLLDYLQDVGDPATGMVISTAADMLASAAAGERADADERYPAMAAVARREGFDEIADWFETMARAEAAQADRFQRLLDGLL